MKLKLNIRQKILVYILGPSIVVFAGIFTYTTRTSRSIAYSQAIKLTDNYARQYALNIEEWLNQDFAITRTLAAAFLEYKQMPFEQWQRLIYPMYDRIIRTTPHIDAYWDSWEMSNLDPTWSKPYGRYFYIVYKENGAYKSKAELRSLTGDPENYGVMKKAGKEFINEPYVSALQRGQLMTTLSSPLLENGKYIGLIGVDLLLTRFQNLVNGIKPYPNSYAFLLSHKGNFIAHPDSTIFQKNITQRLPELNSRYSILANVQKGKAFSFTQTGENGQRLYYTFSPVTIGNTQTPWSVGIVVPINDILYEANKNYNISIAILILGLILLVAIVFFVSSSITGPIKSITRLLQDLANGKVDSTLAIKHDAHDEIGKMALALSESIKGINDKTEFAREIGSGNLKAEVALLSQDDHLGKSLLEMRDNLQRAKEEEEKRKAEDEKKKWTNEGLAKFGDILRQNNNNLSKLSDEIIKNLVWYLNASLGGIFVLNENKETGEKTFELVAAFAYDRKRILNKSYQFAEGLVGACAAEKDIIMLTEIPQEYIEITSGLGGTNPNFLLLTPLINEDEVMGVIEIASLRRFEEHEILFVKEIAKSIATTLHSVKVNSLTAELLMKSKEQAEIMAAQEEEMRQNMEELQATQEEAARKTFELEGLANALNTSSMIMEYDPTGVITSINEKYAELLSISRENTVGKHYSDMVTEINEKEKLDKLWKEIRSGKTKSRKVVLSIKGKELTLVETYTPILDPQGKLYKVLKIATDITNL